VSEGHRIGEKVRGELIAEIEEVADVTVHIDPEDDETRSPCDHSRYAKNCWRAYRSIGRNCRRPGPSRTLPCII